jgi:hypothetical protein
MDKQREKLIELMKNAPLLNVLYGGEEEWELAADHLLANGVIVPPCKVGDIFYQPIRWDGYIDECKVSSLTMKADGSYKIRLTSGRYRCVQETTPEHIGKTVFLSREDAEKALKGVE